MNPRHPDADLNDVYPTTKQEREAMRQEYQEGAIAPLQCAIDGLHESAQYLRECPGHHAEIARAERIAGEVESLIVDLGGEPE